MNTDGQTGKWKLEIGQTEKLGPPFSLFHFPVSGSSAAPEALLIDTEQWADYSPFAIHPPLAREVRRRSSIP
jgi:hypothetical protein